MPTPDRAMIVAAHPDDGEFMAGGTVALWTREGAEVSLVIVTNGNKGTEDPEMTSEKLAVIREEEQRRAAKSLGIGNVIFLDYEDGMLQPSLELRRDLAGVIRKLRPHTVITFDPSTRFIGENYPNHPDHRAAGDATVDAVFPAARDRLTFPELLDQGLEPHKVRELWLGGSATPNHWVDIEATLEAKIKALRIHESQLADMDLEKFIPEMAKGQAEDTNHNFVESFRRVVLD